LRDGSLPDLERVVSTEPTDITGLLRRWSEGDGGVLDQIVPILYDRLHRLASHRIRHEPGASINTTELVHEAYLKLVDSPTVTLKDRSHFLTLAARVMRHVLVDRARARKTAKRGSGLISVRLDSDLRLTDEKLDVIEDLDEALTRLEQLDPRQSRILEHRYFGGLSLEETAAALDISLATVKRELRSARAWLTAELRGEPVL